MSVANMWFYNQRNDTKSFLETSTSGKAPANGARTQWRTLIDVAVLNSRVILDRKEANGPLVPMGDSVELGLYRFLREIVADRTGMDIEEYRSENPKVRGTRTRPSCARECFV
jgi:hypothetical protein